MVSFLLISFSLFNPGNILFSRDYFNIYTNVSLYIEVFYATAFLPVNKDCHDIFIMFIFIVVFLRDKKNIF